MRVSRIRREIGTMARPLPTPESHRNGTNGSHHGNPRHQDLFHGGLAQLGGTAAPNEAEEFQELEQLRSENAQLRALCGDLEQALEASQQADQVWAERTREYEALL